MEGILSRNTSYTETIHSLVVNGLIFMVLLLVTGLTQAQVVNSFQKISSTAGNFTGRLDNGDDFGESISQIGDLDGDGIVDVAVGVRLDDDGGSNRGAVFILFMNRDGTVRQQQKISSIRGGFTGVLKDNDEFGLGVIGIGDLDADGYPDIAVGAGADGIGINQGVVWILFLNPNGTVRQHQMITESIGGFNGNFFTGRLDNHDRFGSDLGSLGDFDGDGIPDIAVSADGDDDGGSSRGAFYILYLNSNGTVKNYRKISSTQGGFRGRIDNGDLFGSTVTNLGDLNGDGMDDLAVGAQFDDDGGSAFGAVWILFMNSNGTVRGFQKISATSGGFTGQLDINDEFGQSVSVVGDINNDGIPDLAVGAEFDDDGADKAGAVYILTLNRDGTVQNTQKISGTSENFTSIRANSEFGQAIAPMGDLNLDGVPDIIVTADAERDPGPQTGAAYVVFLNGTPSGPVNQAPVLAPIANQTVSEGAGLIIPVSAIDADGPPVLVLSVSGLPVGSSFVDSGSGNGQFSWTPFAGAATNSPYTVTFRAADGSGLSNTREVVITVTPAVGAGGGVLTGNTAEAANSINLTSEGSADWIHWSGSSNVNRNAAVISQISDFTVIGTEAPQGASADSTYVWSNGTPTSSNTVANGSRVFRQGNGFQITVPADTTPRTLRLYVGAKSARGLLQATLSDASSPDTSVLVDQPNGLGSHVVTLSYQAASADQTLTLSYTVETRYLSGATASQINIESATLSQ